VGSVPSFARFSPEGNGPSNGGLAPGKKKTGSRELLAERKGREWNKHKGRPRFQPKCGGRLCFAGGGPAKARGRRRAKSEPRSAPRSTINWPTGQNKFVWARNFFVQISWGLAGALRGKKKKLSKGSFGPRPRPPKKGLTAHWPITQVRKKKHSPGPRIWAIAKFSTPLPTPRPPLIATVLRGGGPRPKKFTCDWPLYALFSANSISKFRRSLLSLGPSPIQQNFRELRLLIDQTGRGGGAGRGLDRSGIAVAIGPVRATER